MDPDTVFNVCRSLRRPGHAANFYKTDLHVHSPESFDFKGEKKTDAAEFVRAIVDRGFDLIAITDHHSGAFIDKAREVAKDLEAQGHHIAIVAGVELDTSTGVHLTALLPDDCGTAEIVDLLSSLGVPPNSQGKEGVIVEQSISAIAAAVHERRGLLIGAHVSSDKGVVKDLVGEARLSAIRNLDVLELNASKTNAERTIEYVRTALHSEIPFVFSSDSHDHSTQSDTMWVKMAKPGFNGLRQLIFEPELRVSRAKPAAPEHSWIVGCVTTAGIYANVNFKFSPHLNVLIGGRGAGKSALIDLIRFAFETEKSVEGEDRRLRERIAGFLRGGGDVVILIASDDGNSYGITRSGSFVNRSASGPEFSERSEVYQLTETAAVPRDLRPADVMPVEFYAQGEVSRLADQISDQLRLIDDNLDVEGVASSEEAAGNSLSELEQQIDEAISHIDALQTEIASRSGLEERAAALSKSLQDPVFTSHGLWAKEREFLDSLGKWAGGIAAGVTADLDEPVLPVLDMDSTPSKDLLQKAKASADDSRKKFNGKLSDVRTISSAASADYAAHRATWDAAYKKADDAYRAKLVEIGESDMEAVAKEREDVQAQIDRIVASVEPDLKKDETKLKELHAEWIRVFEQLDVDRTALHDERLAVVDDLNKKLQGRVRIEFSDAGDVTEYVGLLDQTLEGSGIQNRSDKLAALAQSVTPRALALAIGQKKEKELQDAGLSESDTIKVIRAFGEPLRLQLARIATPANPDIKLRREGDTSYSGLGELSIGEKCSAVLSIALLNRKKPLVIDQPEDDLDHAFVTESIVESIRSVKHERQIITATHNPNIPVLGDAEMIFRVARLPGQEVCEIRTSGGLEIPSITKEVQLLEGGVDAFERRRRRYQDR